MANIFALIVGINQYKYADPDELWNLHGAVNDANTMYYFLHDKVKVPSSNIFLLLDGGATRKAILETFTIDLINNRNIQKGDLIIFFYAGHGARVDAPLGWPSNDGKIESVCAYDTMCKRQYRQDVEKVNVIPDRTINSLLRRLAHEKGNNIVVILDCCFSGGMTRESQTQDLDPPRFCKEPLPIDSDLDQDIWDTERQASRGGYPDVPYALHAAWGSHVLLAACRELETSQSIKYNGETRGAFTHFLIHKLSFALKSKVLKTYAMAIDELAEEMKPYIKGQQTPQCEGLHRERFVFSTESFSKNSREFCVEYDRQSGSYKVVAGTIHGVGEGTEFLLKYLNSDHEVGLMVARNVGTNSALLYPRPGDRPFGIPEPVRAILVFSMPVYAQPGLLPQTRSHFFHPLSSRVGSQVALRQGPGNRIIFERHDPLMSTLAQQEVSHDIRPDRRGHDLPMILAAISHFNYHLQRTKIGPFLTAIGVGPGDLFNQVKVRFLHLRSASLQLPYPTPDPRTGDLFQGYMASVIGNNDASYGFEILNYSNKDLFVYIFIFDPLDYSIEPYYQPFNPNMAPPLKAANNTKNPGMLSVGYGTGGVDPLTFIVSEGARSETSFFKFFVSERYVNMDHIRQCSAFDMNEKREDFNLNDGQWGTLLTSITACR